MKISLSRAMFETRHEFSGIGRLLREAETAEEDPKADLKKKAMASVKKQSEAMSALSAKLVSSGFKSTGAAIATAADTLKSLSVEADLNDEGVGKFVASRTLVAALVNLFTGISGEIGEVGEETEDKTVAEILSDKGIKSLEKTIELNFVPSPGADKLLKKQNKQFADIFKKEEGAEAPKETTPTTSATAPSEPAQAGVAKESRFAVSGNTGVITEAGLGDIFAELIKKFLSTPPKSAKQTVQFVKPLLGDKNIAQLLKKDLSTVTYQQYMKFIPSVKGVFIAANPEKTSPTSPEAEAGAVPPDTAVKGAQVAADSPELVDRIATATEKAVGDAASPALEALKKIANGVPKEDAVKGLDDASVELLKPILAKLAAGGANTSPGDVAKAVSSVAPSSEAGAGKTLSSLLFVPKSTRKRKEIGEKGEAIDKAIKGLSSAWEEYTSPEETKFDSAKRKEIISRFQSMKDTLSDIATESRAGEEEIIIERWQRLAGIK